MSRAASVAPKTKREALAAIAAFPKEKKASAMCALVGHSRLLDFCFYYFTCARCDAQVGDSLTGSFVAKGVVVSGHGKLKVKECDCRAVAKKLTWRDTALVKRSVADHLAGVEA